MAASTSTEKAPAEPPAPPAEGGGGGGAGGAGAAGVDTDLYSRMIYVVGLESMSKLASYSVLIAGLNGTGVEVRAYRAAHLVPLFKLSHSVLLTANAPHADRQERDFGWRPVSDAVGPHTGDTW